jgi:hypothetical protein
MMQEARHTPGPWRASSDLIVGGEYIPSNPTAPRGKYEIAKVISQEKPGLYPWQPDYATYEANSRLIEAAPTMLAEIKEAAAWFSTIARCSGDESIKEIARKQFDRLRAVIREAEAA